MQPIPSVAVPAAAIHAATVSRRSMAFETVFIDGSGVRHGPQRDVARLHGVGDDHPEVGREPVEVDLVANGGAEVCSV